MIIFEYSYMDRGLIRWYADSHASVAATWFELYRLPIQGNHGCDRCQRRAGNAGSIRCITPQAISISSCFHTPKAPDSVVLSEPCKETISIIRTMPSPPRARCHDATLPAILRMYIPPSNPNPAHGGPPSAVQEQERPWGKQSRERMPMHRATGGWLRLRYPLIGQKGNVNHYFLAWKSREKMRKGKKTPMQGFLFVPLEKGKRFVSSSSIGRPAGVGPRSTDGRTGRTGRRTLCLAL